MSPADSEMVLRLLGVEDGSFEAFLRERASHAFLCCVELESDLIRKIRLARIQVDGFDATEKLLGILHGIGAEAIILGGITFAGFNIIDPKVIFDEVSIPVIIYSGTRPDNDEILSALRKHFDDWRRRWEIIESLGPVHIIEPYSEEPPIYFEVVGGSPEWAEAVLCGSARISRIPEPVRVAGLVARGLSPAS